jgi:nicotinamidase-related amidase
MAPKTLLQMAGAAVTPSKLSDAVLVVIDAQKEYVDGKLPLTGVTAALAEIKKLITRAREIGTPVIHIQHKGKPGGAFGPDTSGFAIAPEAAPHAGETVIEKSLPNAFAGTELENAIEATGKKEIILAGFMTHMCIEATARSALDHGLKATVVASAAATRDLPDPLTGGIVSAAEVHRNALTALSDRFAVIAPDTKAIAD